MTAHVTEMKMLALILILSSVFQTTIAPSLAVGKEAPKVLQGNIQQNELIDNLERLGIKCIIQDGADRKLVVRDVRMGSNAFYKGMSAGDVIKTLSKSGDVYNLTFERAGQTYMLPLKPLIAASDVSALTAGTKQTSLSTGASENQLNLQAGKARLASQNTPIVDMAPHTVPIIDVNQKNIPIVDVNSKHIPIVEVDPKEQEKKLVRYDIELIIDITGSMAWVDGTGSLTKFQWCHEQVRKLAQRLAPYKKTLTITTFNTEFDTKVDCDPGQVEQIYATVIPEGGTDLVDPVRARCDACLERQRTTGRPQLIAIISDGLPNIPTDPKAVNRALINFSQRLTEPGQVTITFLQIGDTFDGKDFCLDLDENLANEGAKFDMVNTKTFAQLKSRGMLDCLVDAVQENAQYKAPGMRHYNRFVQTLPNAKDVMQAESSLQEKKNERKQLEKQLLQH